MLIGERFGTPPEVIEELPADRSLFYRGIYAIEGEMAAAIHGLSPDQPLILEDED